MTERTANGGEWNNSNEGQEPMIRLQPGGVAPVLSYNVPEPTTYSGRNFIDLQLHDGYFMPTNPAANASLQPQKAMKGGAAEPSPVEVLRSAQQSGERLTSRLANLGEEEVLRKASEGQKLNIHRTMTGALTYSFLNAASSQEPVFAAASSDLHSDGEAPFISAMRAKEDDGGIIGMRPRDDIDPLPQDPPDPVVISINITSPAAGSTVSGAHTGASVDIRGNAYLASGDGSISKVQVQVGSGAFQTATLSPDGSWVLPVVLTTPGPVTITAKATHSPKLITASAKHTVHVTLAQAPDTEVPTVKITSPAAGELLNTKGGPAAIIQVEGTASDNRGVAKVEVIVDGGAPVMAESGNGFTNWKKQISLAAGNHTIAVRCYDAANNVGTDSITVYVDGQPPRIGITSPANDATFAGTFSQGAVIEVFGTAEDAGGIDRVEVSHSENPIFIRAAEKAPNDWSTWKATFTVNSTNTHIITARAIDRSNNVTETTIAVKVSIMPEVNSRLKRIILVESYRMSSYLANYGAGRTIKTFSLLPGEKSKISIRSYNQNEITAKSAATILDSVTDDISAEFEKSIATEQADQKNYSESNEYKIEGEAGVSWGWGSASISASTSGGTNAAREQFAKNVVNNTQKHVAKASARRDVQINTTYEEKSTSTEEVSIVREIENINVSRTLNFVFRQMNQEFITLLHLVDVRIGYFTIDMINGEEKKSYREVTLPQLDALLAEVIVQDKRIEVRNAILNQLMNIFDYQDRHHAFIEEEPFKKKDGTVIPLSNYLRIKKDYTSTYSDGASGTEIEVPGIILAANRHVLRTDGIVVEALLGQGEALDNYSRNLQIESVREKELRNELLEAEVAMKRLALQIMTNKDSEAAQIYKLLNPDPQPAEKSGETEDTSTGNLAGVR